MIRSSSALMEAYDTISPRLSQWEERVTAIGLLHVSPSQAALACSMVSAQTMAIASPYWKTLVSHQNPFLKSGIIARITRSARGE